MPKDYVARVERMTGPPRARGLDKWERWTEIWGDSAGLGKEKGRKAEARRLGSNLPVSQGLHSGVCTVQGPGRAR